MILLPATDATVADLRAWFDEWATQVRAQDYAAARDRFHPDVIGFGTYMRLVHGRDRLEQDQWRAVWPTISDFRFLTDELQAGASDDRSQAWAVVPWTSTGYAEDGAPFERPGRATVVFVRDTPDGRWLAIHTHISLAPGTPQRSFGDRS